MNTRRPTTSDVNKLYELESKVFETEFYPLFFFRQAIELFPDTIYIAEKTNNLIGYCIGSSVTGHNDKGWILSLAVDENFRRKGIGTELVKKVIDELTIIGCQEILLTVLPKNVSSKKIFEMIGFKKIAEDENYFGEGNPREIMSLKIK